jgi:ESF2/ABP1 family protein
MNVKIIRDYFSRFGTVDRIYLEPYEKKRKNQARSFSEGWVEFKSKKLAAKVARDLNSTQVGGKRKNPWYHELWNLKYLKKFRWTHLNERKAYEQEIRKQRLRQEVNLAKKETSFYIQNVEKSKVKYFKFFE